MLHATRPSQQAAEHTERVEQLSDGRNREAISDPGMLYVARLALAPFGAFDDNSEGDLDRSA